MQGRLGISVLGTAICVISGLSTGTFHEGWLYWIAFFWLLVALELRRSRKLDYIRIGFAMYYCAPVIFMNSYGIILAAIVSFVAMFRLSALCANYHPKHEQLFVIPLGLMATAACISFLRYLVPVIIAMYFPFTMDRQTRPISGSEEFFSEIARRVRREHWPRTPKATLQELCEELWQTLHNHGTHFSSMMVITEYCYVFSH